MISIRLIKEYLFHLLFLLLFVMAFIFYKERLLLDASLYFFKAINSAAFDLGNASLSMGFAQTIPLIAYYLGAKLQILMLLSSLGQVLIYYLLFLYLFYYLKDETSVILLFLLLFSGELSYFIPHLEIQYGAAFGIVFYCSLKKENYVSDKQYALLIFWAFMLLNSHLINQLLFLFLLLWDVIDKGYQKRPHLPLFVMLPIFLLLEFSTMHQIELNTIADSLINAPEYVFHLHFKVILKAILKYYPELFLALAATTALLFYRKLTAKACLLLATFVSIQILIHYLAQSNEMVLQTEIWFKTLYIIAFVPFLNELFTRSSIQWRGVLFLGFLLVCFVRTYLILDISSVMRDRTAQMQRLIAASQEREGSKFIYNEENIQKEYSIHFQSNILESLLLSAMHDKEKAVSLIGNSDYLYKNNENKLKMDNHLLSRLEVENDSNFNPRLFQLESGKYVSMNQVDLQYDPQLLKDSVHLALWEEKRKFKRSDIHYLDIQIKNLSKHALPSKLSSNLRLSYHWYDENHEVVVWDGLRTPLEVDVKNEFYQHIAVQMPDSAGIYYLQPDIVVEGLLWLSNTEKYKIEVD